MSFFLAIPALTAAGVLQAVTEADQISNGIGWGPTVVALVTSFFVAYASIAWLLRYVSGHNFAIFILYRVGLGVGARGPARLGHRQRHVKSARLGAG